jgi:hypothetical protein
MKAFVSVLNNDGEILGAQTFDLVVESGYGRIVGAAVVPVVARGVVSRMVTYIPDCDVSAENPLRGASCHVEVGDTVTVNPDNGVLVTFSK